jgi:RNA recognition motif-containing protein
MNIYVGNLSYDMTENDLHELFGEYGTIVKANIIMDRDSGRSKGFGFVEMEDSAEGKKAIEELDGQSVKGRNLKVNEARPREERPPRRRDW